jgi:5-methylcytosine-specific restriction endonuclease McrA
MKDWGNFSRIVRTVEISSDFARHEPESDDFFYSALLSRPEWQTKRLEILHRDANRCAFCQSAKNLEVHHRQYHYSESTGQHLPPWQYADALLITVCKKCHDKGHQSFRVPTYKVK